MTSGSSTTARSLSPDPERRGARGDSLPAHSCVFSCRLRARCGRREFGKGVSGLGRLNGGSPAPWSGSGGFSLHRGAGSQAFAALSVLWPPGALEHTWELLCAWLTLARLSCLPTKRCGCDDHVSVHPGAQGPKRPVGPGRGLQAPGGGGGGWGGVPGHRRPWLCWSTCGWGHRR